nr:TetR/AcrR family transcriptional regulator C-terminal domain-containing protein [Arthrobacter sp. zg-Y1116]
MAARAHLVPHLITCPRRRSKSHPHAFLTPAPQTLTECPCKRVIATPGCRSAAGSGPRGIHCKLSSTEGTAVSRNLPLSPAAIAAAALRIADADGLEAVSMRRVAGEFGVSAMALYRHVADRSALLLLMADAATKDYALLPARDLSWQETLAHLADAQWRAFTAHPWLLRIILTPRRLVNMATPDEVELVLSRLGSAGLSEDEGFDCLLGISAAVIGTASITAAAHFGAPGKADDSDSSGHPHWTPDAVEQHPRAARFQAQGISYSGSRRSLDFFVANFIAGVEQQLTQAPGAPTRPVSRKEENETQQ